MRTGISLRRCGVVRAVLCAGVLTCAAMAAASELPTGFQETVFVSGVDSPVAFAWAPDGDLLIATRSREVWIYRAGQLILAGVVPGSDLGERSISGFALDPAYETNHHVWIYYTSLPPERNRLSRFTIENDALGDELLVLEGPLLSSTVHNGGCLVFAEDGTLFLGTGDDALGSGTAQDLHDLRGKILHLHADGSPVADNPYVEGVEGHPLVWAYGLRNPYRCNMQPGDRNLFIGDVGAAGGRRSASAYVALISAGSTSRGRSPAGSPATSIRSTATRTRDPAPL